MKEYKTYKCLTRDKSHSNYTSFSFLWPNRVVKEKKLKERDELVFRNETEIQKGKKKNRKKNRFRDAVKENEASLERIMSIELEHIWKPHIIL